jgi:NAD(P)-dependent dehydrogenase (short-subunit alcohol dehydrogenase family)
MNPFQLKNKIVLVTGGYGHLGEGIARSFLEAGAQVIVGGRDESRFKSVFSEIESSKVQFLNLDISDEKKIIKAAAELKKRFEGLDVLVNNAIASPHLDAKNKGSATDVWRRGILGNLETVQMVTEHFLPLLKVSKSANVINVSSMYGMVAPDFSIYQGTSPSPSYYGAAKAGVIQLTKYMASLYGAEGIRFNCVTPGPFPKPVNQSDKKFLAELKKRTLLGRMGTPPEIGAPCVFLASEAASYITGHNLVVDGGWTVR